MASVVSIQIRIDDGDSAAVLSKVEQGLASVGVQGNASMKQLSEAADEGSAGLQRLGGHTTTSLDNVRLLSQEFGIRLPRAMENALARFPAVAAGLGAFSSGLLALGAAEVFVHMGEELYSLEQKFISINAPVDEFYDKLKKTSELDFSNTRQLATTNFRQGQAENTAQVAPRVADSMHTAGIANLFSGMSGMGVGVGELLGAHDIAQMGVTAQGQDIELQRKRLDQEHELYLKDIENAHLHDEALQTRAKNNAEAQKQYDINFENRRYSTKVEEFYNNRTPGNAGAAEQNQADARAGADADIKNTQLDRENALLSLKASDTRNMAGLEGAAERWQKELNAEREITLELTNQGHAEQANLRVAQMQAQYKNQELTHLRELAAQTQKLSEESTAAGLKGVPRVDAELQSRLLAINDAERKDRMPDDPDAAAKAAYYEQQRVAARRVADQQITEIETDFTARMQGLIDQRGEAEMGGFARIDAGAQREKDSINKTFSESFGADGRGANDSDTAARDAALGAVDQTAQKQKEQLAAKNAADDLTYTREATQAEARVREQGIFGWVASYKNGIAEIQAQEKQREAKLSEDLKKGDIKWRDYERRKADVEASANAEIAEQSQRLQQQIAGQLQQAFTNPVQFIKSEMEKMMFEIVAAWILRLDVFKSVFGSTMGGLQPGAAAAGAGGIAGGALGHILGVGGAMSAAGRPAGTAGVISAGTSLPAEHAGTVSFGGGSPASSADYTSTAMSAPALSAAWSSTASVAAVPASAGGVAAAQGGWGGAAVPSSAVGRGGGVSGDVSAARGLYAQIHKAGLFGGAASAGAAQDSTVPPSPGDNGEGGGFAGYMTGNTDDMSIGAAEGDDSIGAQATQQATAMQSTAGGPSAGLAAGMGIAGAAMGAYGGGKGVYESFFQGGGKGALDGTMSGVEMGASLGSVIPGLGTVIGGALGGVVGLATNLVGDVLGESGKMAARDYYRKTLFPEMEGIDKDYANGSGSDWRSALAQANSKSAEGYAYMRNKWGGDAAGWVKSNYLDKETAKVIADITDAAKGGKMYMGRAASEFHTGGVVTGFRDLATSPSEGYAHLEMGEHITNVRSTSEHAPYLQAINSGANAAQMAAMYLQSASGGRTAAPATTIAGHTMNVHAMDAKSFGKWLDGGANDEVARSLNQRVASYSGDSY